MKDKPQVLRSSTKVQRSETFVWMERFDVPTRVDDAGEKETAMLGRCRCMMTTLMIQNQN